MSNAKVYSNIGQAFWLTYPVLKTTAESMSSVEQLLNGEDHDITGGYKNLFDQAITPPSLTSDSLGFLYNRIAEAVAELGDKQIKTNSNRTVSFAKGLDTVASEVHSMAVTTNNGNSQSTAALHIGKQNSGRAYPVSFLISSQLNPRYQYCL